MNEMFCSYSGNREEALVAYLYGDVGPFERTAFESHLGGCAACRRELAGLGVVRERLAQWSPPEPRSLGDLPDDSHDAPVPMADGSPWWQQLPAWAQVAAAMLFLGVSAGVANLDIKYDQGGLSVRTGWSSPPAVADRAVGQSTTADGAISPVVSRQDLTTLEQQLRAEMRSQLMSLKAEAPSSGEMSDGEILRRVRALIDESEKQERRELALRVAEVYQNVQGQRQSDLAKIDRTIGALQYNTGFEVMRQREQLNSLAVRVSQSR
jgi:hypothetical protein